MKITDIPHDCKKFFLNGAFASMENYVLINDEKEIFRNGRLFKIKGNYSCEHPKLEILSSKKFILIDSGLHTNSKDERGNAWIINENGQIEKSFFLGSVHRILATKKYLICSYIGSQLDTNWKYGQNGIVVFNYEGESKFEYYKDEAKHKWLNWIENYSFYKQSENSIYYMPYPKFPIVEFRLTDFSSEIRFQIPSENELGVNEFWNPKAFSKKGNDWFFITPDIEKSYSRIFKMNSKKRVEQIGTCCFSHFPKGMEGGKFFIPFSGGTGKQRKCQFIEI